MSTRVPAHLYAYSSVHGFRPIDSKPGESTPDKSGSGLLDKLERSLPLGKPLESTADKAPIVGGSNPQSTSTVISESQNPIALRILTWNIWFESTLKQQRTSALINTIKFLDPPLDVCCFQECTAGFESQLQRDDWWRETWAMSKCAEQFTVTGSHYGTMVFVRRELVGKMGFGAKAWFEPFQVTQNGRGLLVLELTPPKSKHPVWWRVPTNLSTHVTFTDPRLTFARTKKKLLIATSHMEYAPEIRATQFAAAVSTLSTTPTSIFCGDTNIDTYPELEPLLSAGYVDSWLETHSDFANSPDLRAVGVTFGTTGLLISGHQVGSGSDDGGPRRLDYLMARGMRVVNCELVGDVLIPGEEWTRTSEPEEQGIDLEVYVSDHLGVLVDVELG